MADDFVKQFQSGPPVHTPKSLEENLREEAIEWEARKRADPKLVDAAWTDINDAMTVQHQAAPTHEPTAAERDQQEKDERQFLEAFERGLSERLVSYQMAVKRCSKDGEGQGWRIFVRDSAGRPFDVRISYDEAIRAGQRYGDRMGQELMSIVTRRLLGAREAYFRRMQ